jgi:hypothetical protein
MFFFWRKKRAPTLQQGAEKFDAVLRGLDESRRAFKESSAGPRRVFSPSEDWSKKYLSQGIGAGTAFARPIACFEDGTCLPPRNQLMRELAARAKTCDCADKETTSDIRAMADIGNVPMRKPFAPEKPKRKRSWLA